MATNGAELVLEVGALPELSRRVFMSLVRGLYAEPGFSDVDSRDIATDLSLSTQVVRGALSNLEKCGMVSSDECNGYILLYPDFWSSSFDDAEAARELLMASFPDK